MSRTPLFVYGTLLSGERSHALLHDGLYAGDISTTSSFELVDLGEYPALIAGGGTPVRGELYWIPSTTRAALDEFEGHPTMYRRTWIKLEGGEIAQTYLLTRPPSPADRRAIPHGDWRAWRRETQTPVG